MKGFKKYLVAGAVIVLAVVLLGAVTQGFQKFKVGDVKEHVIKTFTKERNPDNMIKTVLLESGKHPQCDVTVDVDKYGRVTLNGTSTATAVLTYANVSLLPGTYYLTGDWSGSSTATEFMCIYDSENNFVKRADMGAFTITNSGTYTVKIWIRSGVQFQNVEIAPIVSRDEDTPFFVNR